MTQKPKSFIEKVESLINIGVGIVTIGGAAFAVYAFFKPGVVVDWAAEVSRQMEVTNQSLANIERDTSEVKDNTASVAAHTRALEDAIPKWVRVQSLEYLFHTDPTIRGFSLSVQNTSNNIIKKVSYHIYHGQTVLGASGTYDIGSQELLFSNAPVAEQITISEASEMSISLCMSGELASGQKIYEKRHYTSGIPRSTVNFNKASEIVIDFKPTAPCT